MLLNDEQYVIKWLSQYGALPKTQVLRLLRDKSPDTAEKIIRNLKREQRIADVGDGYYLGQARPACYPCGLGVAEIYRLCGPYGALPGHLSRADFLFEGKCGIRSCCTVRWGAAFNQTTAAAG